MSDKLETHIRDFVNDLDDFFDGKNVEIHNYRTIINSSGFTGEIKKNNLFEFSRYCLENKDKILEGKELTGRVEYTSETSREARATGGSTNVVSHNIYIDFELLSSNKDVYPEVLKHLLCILSYCNNVDEKTVH